ncbi:hypothetical protein ACLKA6_002642 [Drosophila palustris]
MIICQRAQNVSPDVFKKLELLLSEPHYVRVLRAVHNVLPSHVEQPFTPNDPPIMQYKSDESDRLNNTAIANLSPHVDESPERALDFRLNVSNLNERPIRERHIQNSDIEKGLEVVGRQLARRDQLDWHEYWDFLDTFIDIASSTAHTRLDSYLSAQLDQSQSSLLSEKSDQLWNLSQMQHYLDLIADRSKTSNAASGGGAIMQVMTPYTCVEKSLQRRKLLQLNGDHREHLQPPTVQLPDALKTEELCSAAWQLTDISNATTTLTATATTLRNSLTSNVAVVYPAAKSSAHRSSKTHSNDDDIDSDDEMFFYECGGGDSSEDEDIFLTPPESRSPRLSCDLEPRHELFTFGFPSPKSVQKTHKSSSNSAIGTTPKTPKSVGVVNRSASSIVIAFRSIDASQIDTPAREEHAAIGVNEYLVTNVTINNSCCKHCFIVIPNEA